MSTFQVTSTINNKITVNANHVLYVLTYGENTIIQLTGDISIETKASYRSVRGYLKKALSGAKTQEKEEE